MEWKKLTFDVVSCNAINEQYVYTKALSALASAAEIIFPSITAAYGQGAAYMRHDDPLTRVSCNTLYTTSGYWLTTARTWSTTNNNLGICCMRNTWGLQGLPCSLSYVYYKIIYG